MEHKFEIKLEDVFSTFDGRRYSKEQIKKMVEEFAKKAKDDKAYGELGHPSSPILTLERIAYKITDINIGDDFEGTVSTDILVSKGYKDSGVVSTCGDMLAEMNIKEGFPASLKLRIMDDEIISIDIEPIVL